MTVVVRSRGGYRARKRGGIPFHRKTGFIPSDSFASTALYVQLEYATTWITLNTSPSEEYTFLGNGLYQCNHTALTGQPLGWDQYANFFHSYRVTASKIALHVAQGTTGGVAGAPTAVTVVPTSSASLSTFTQTESMPYSRLAVLGNYTGNKDVTQITHFFKTEDEFAGAKYYRRLTGVFVNNPASNPLRKWYWNTSWNTCDGSNLDLKFKVVIKYYVQLFSPKVLNASSL